MPLFGGALVRPRMADRAMKEQYGQTGHDALKVFQLHGRSNRGVVWNSAYCSDLGVGQLLKHIDVSRHKSELLVKRLSAGVLAKDV